MSTTTTAHILFVVVFVVVVDPSSYLGHLKNCYEIQCNQATTEDVRLLFDSSLDCDIEAVCASEKE